MKISTDKAFKSNMTVFLKVNSCIKEYKEDKIYWLNMMYYSSINLKNIHQTGQHHAIFKKKYLNINYLNVEDIVIPLDLMIIE